MRSASSKTKKALSLAVDNNQAKPTEFQPLKYKTPTQKHPILPQSQNLITPEQFRISNPYQVVQHNLGSGKKFV